MIGLRAYVVHGPGKGGIEAVPDPVVGEHDALVEMVVCGICSSTDRMIRDGSFRGRLDYPLILGHESVGRVIEVGSAVRKYKYGDLVTRSAAYRPGGGPVELGWGGFAEYGVVTDWDAAVADGVAGRNERRFVQCGFRDVHDPADLSLGISLSETFSMIVNYPLVRRLVGIVGTGVAGLSFTRYARLLGAGHVVVVGRREERLERAMALGADDAVLAGTGAPEKLFASLGGAEVVFEASGDAEAVARAFTWLRQGGSLVVYGSPARPAPIDLMGGAPNVTITKPKSDEGAVMPGVVEMVGRGLVDGAGFVTHRFPFTEIDEAFRVTDHGDAVKALVDFAS